MVKEYVLMFEGEVLEVILEEKYKEDFESGLYVGYIDNYLKVVFKVFEEMVGKFVKVKIIKVGYLYNEGEFVCVLDEVYF